MGADSGIVVQNCEHGNLLGDRVCGSKSKKHYKYNKLITK